MVWIYTETEPQPIEVKKSLGQKQVTLNYHIQEAIDAPEPYKWRHESVILEPGIWHRDAIIEALIRAEYSQCQVEAITNNYLLDPTWDDALEEMRELQTWRQEAKRIADEALAILPAFGQATPEAGFVQNSTPSQNAGTADQG